MLICSITWVVFWGFFGLFFTFFKLDSEQPLSNLRVV